MNSYRVGIIGCGTIFYMHAYALRHLQNTEIKAVCDIKPESLETARPLFDCDTYDDYHKLIERKDIDVIHILTPNYLHAEMAIAAANAGKHVLVEKPMAIDIESARKIVEAGKRNHVTIGVISQNRYNDTAKAIKRAINDGSLGNVISQGVVLSWTKPARYYLDSDWRGTWDKEGGSLMIDQAIHILDLARWFINDEIASVQATISNRNHPEIETEDSAEGMIIYRNGVKCVFLATNNFTCRSPIMVETQFENGTALLEYDRAVITCHKNNQIRETNNNNTEGFDETEFKSFFNEDSCEVASRMLKQWGVVHMPVIWNSERGYWGMGHLKQITNFYENLAKGIEPDISAAEALKTQELICAIYQSARENRVIEF